MAHLAAIPNEQISCEMLWTLVQSCMHFEAPIFQTEALQQHLLESRQVFKRAFARWKNNPMRKSSAQSEDDLKVLLQTILIHVGARMALARSSARAARHAEGLREHVMLLAVLLKDRRRRGTCSAGGISSSADLAPPVPLRPRA